MRPARDHMPSRRRAVLLIVACGCLAGLTACSTPAENATPAAAAEPTVEPGRYLPDFDAAWQLVYDTHYDTGFNGVDWQAVRDELRPRVAEARTRSEARAVIQEMVGRLNQSHFGLIPQEIERATAAARAGDDEPDDAESDQTAAGTPAEIPAGDSDGRARPGFDVRVIDGRAVVSSVLPGGPADEAGVEPGWVLTKVRKTEVGPIIAGLAEAVGEREAIMYTSQTISGMLQGREGSEVALTFLDADDDEVTLEVARAEPPGQFVKFGNLPPMSTNLDYRWLTPEETGDPDAKVGYIAFNIFMIPIAPQFERAMVALQDADGIVIDLRGNPGGVGAMAAALARFFVTDDARLGTMTMRNAELQFNVEPIVVTSRGERLAPFTGPLALVIDGTSASTSEVFAGGLRAIDRAETFGTPSAGMALPAAMSRLPSGDVLLHAIADYVNSDGTRLEGDGVPADHPVPVRREDLLAGKDAPLREAARWIRENAAAAQPVSAETN